MLIYMLTDLICYIAYMICYVYVPWHMSFCFSSIWNPSMSVWCFSSGPSFTGWWLRYLGSLETSRWVTHLIEVSYSLDRGELLTWSRWVTYLIEVSYLLDRGELLTWSRWVTYLIEVSYLLDRGELLTWSRWVTYLIEVSYSLDRGELLTWSRWVTHLIGVSYSLDRGELLTWSRWVTHLIEVSYSLDWGIICLIHSNQPWKYYNSLFYGAPLITCASFIFRLWDLHLLF